ncbi:AI-2E family transporter [Xylophilus sp. GOD-11R]|uniref:AI-2E family transporter n=1 Tax=Xylophilus sp. GOD-11R TaxID=3089814 RepID=UPI00298C5180|nr:AI-2E family transporter [Xylophilus sp. GOD-11R]WPB59324.1 AI-2E family transporter [Xylophilus sp. GOD-11R]
MKSTAVEQKTFLLLLVGVTLAFGWILFPYYGAIFWAAILAMLFRPVFRWLVKRFKGRANLAALCTLCLVLVIVILPTAFITASLVQEGSAIYQKLQSGEINIGRYVQQIFDHVPSWVMGLMERFGVGDMGALQAKLMAALNEGSRNLATSAINFGQNTFDFLVGFAIMLYLLFFLIRDGRDVSLMIRDAIPLEERHKHKLLGKFTTVIRATVKGNIAVAVAQGAIGGITFFFLGIHGAVLWGVLMALLSLLPAIGAGLVWGPVAIYFLATGAVAKALVLVFVGVFVIGLVDNILRPLLVGKDTKLPDYIVLISTIGGMALFGLNGFVIGPVIAAMFISTWDIFASSRDDARMNPPDAVTLEPPPADPSTTRR